MADRIQQRRDTAARWAQHNPVLLEGEVGYVTDNPNQYKIGDGIHAWNDLPLRGYTGTIVQEAGNDENSVISQKTSTELSLYNRISEQGVLEGKGTGEGQIAFYWSNVFFKKGDIGKLRFKSDGTVKYVSAYLTTNKGNLSGGYTTIIESNQLLSQDNEVIVNFIAKSDGYVMFNISAETSVNVTGDIYVSLTSKTEDLENKNVSTHYKLFQFGGIQNKQSDLGGNNQTNWASVVHGIAVQEINTLYAIKARGSISNNLTFRLYKGTGITIDTAFTELIDTIVITPEEFNSIANNDIIKLPLTSKIDISIEDYYTLEVDLAEADAVYSNKLGACDAEAAHNFIRQGFYKTKHGNWIVVSTYPEGKYTYGLLWGAYLGDDASVNFDKDWQSKFYMNILSSLSNKVDKISENLYNDVFNYTIGTYPLIGNNEEGKPNGSKRAFNFTNLELKQGNSYTFKVEYLNEEEIKSLSFYTTNVQGTNNYGYVTVKLINSNNLLTEFTFTPKVDGYLMFNIGATINGSVNVSVSQTLERSQINVLQTESGSLTGGNPDTSYKDNIIKFKYFEKKLFAGKTYQIRLIQNLIRNVPNTEFKSLSCYVVYSQGNLSGGYEAVFESKKGFENNEIIEYTPTKDGYLMLNTYATVNKTFYAIIYSTESLDSRLEDLNNRVSNIENTGSNDLTIKQRAKTVTDNAVGIFPIIKPQFKDVYLTLCGDSIFAFQSTFTKDEKGVAAVPPTCDKKANANMLWNALGWGNPQYRRFDYGKKSLVGDWDNTWQDDSSAMFIETGTFKTEYIGQTRREDSNFAGKIGTNVIQVSTKIDEASFPYQFDKSEDSWWQRNIPKRFSNSANASVKFTIPAGYFKFDFLYHAHIHGDNNVTITIDRGDGVVKVNTVPNDFNGEGAVEANNHVCDLSMSSLNEPGGGNDSYGIPNMRLYFNILDQSQDTTITITKSADTSKYLIYWGVTYWGTSVLPYALHINNMAIGGYTQQAIYNLRSAMFKFIPSDAIIMEMCHNNLANKTFQNQITSMNTYMDNLKTYFESIGKNIKTDIGIWLPHCEQKGYRDYPDTVTCNYAGAEKLAIDKGYNVILNIYKIFNDLHDTYYSDMSMSDFMNSLGNNGVHLGTQGQWIYSAAWESLR